MLKNAIIIGLAVVSLGACATNDAGGDTGGPLVWCHSKHRPLLVWSATEGWWLIRTRRLPFAPWDVYRRTEPVRDCPDDPGLERYAGGFWTIRAAKAHIEKWER